MANTSNEHDELIHTREELRILKQSIGYFKERYDSLFNYFNEKYPDDMVEYLKEN